MMNLMNIENELVKLANERQEATKTYKALIERSDKQIAELKRQKEMVMKGIDIEKVKTAEFILQVRGLQLNEYDDRCVAEAIKDIATGANKMKREYFGVKNYAHWKHQKCDCQYGYGPSHGSVVFSIGYANGFRGDVELTDEEKECCLYYLNLLRNKESRAALQKVTV